MGPATVPSGADFQRMRRLGVTSSRLHLYWGAIEYFAGLGFRNWTSFDRLVADAARAGIRVVPLLYGVPPFIAKNPSTPPLRSESERAKWRKFVFDAVRRYGPGGEFWAQNPELPRLPVTAWQVWNEPNLPVFFGGNVDVSKYRDLLRLTAVAIRAADQGATVITAGIFHHYTGSGSLSMRAFMVRFYRLAGVKQWFDVLALHPYARRPRGVVRAVRRGRRIMRRAKDRKTPVWVTEIGWTTGGAGWEKNAFRATGRQQAKWLRRTYWLFRVKRRLRVERVFWHTYQDLHYPDKPDPWMARMGLLDRHGKRKPSWYAYAKAAGGRS